MCKLKGVPQQNRWKSVMLMQIVALDDASSMPEGWVEHRPPAASPWTNISIYELHIRDFRSAWCSKSLSSMT